MATSSVNNIKIEPSNVTWEMEEKVCVVHVADVAGSLGGKYYSLMGTHYVWFDTGTSVDPSVVGLTGLQVVIVSGDSASVVAGKVQAVIDADVNFSATVSIDQVTITAALVGDKSATVDVDSGVSVVQLQEGGSTDMGLIDGDIETSFEEQTFEVFAHQTGTTLLTDLRQGVSASVSMTLKESDFAKYKEIFSKGGAGDVFTPAGGTEVFGWGTSKVGSNAIVQSRRLILKPVGSTDNSGNLTFWKAYVIPGSIVISGENAKTLSLSFKIYRDDSRDSKIDYFMFGDQTQTGL